MRLLRLELIGQYKGLANQTFDLSRAPGNVVAFIGANGSGKSQLMELVAEVFAYLEREQRREFRVRSSLGFYFRVVYEWTDQPTTGIAVYSVELLPQSRPRVLRRIVGTAADVSSPEEECELGSLPLPRLIGYASGLSENLQRPFLRNAVQYFDVMQVRSRRREELSQRRVDERMVETINQRYRQRHPGIFGDISKEGATDSFLSRESDTALPIGIFLDYDCANLLVASLGLLSAEDRNSLWPEVPFRHPRRTVLRYDLRNVPVEEDSIRDIQQLVRVLGDDCLSPISRKVSDEEFDRYELDYLHADITFDLADNITVNRLKDAYIQPIVLFWKLYKLQLLGVKYWSLEVRRSLRRDEFQGHVEKPLKGRLPLSVIELQMSDGERSVSVDDLSDGETQLLHTIGAVRLFGDAGSLFIFDEPETHLNPSWRTRYHLDFDRASEGLRVSQAFISSHSPFLISSLPREAVFHFDKVEGRTIVVPPGAETFGASFEILIKKFFGLNSAISQTAIDEIRSRLKDTHLDRSEKRAWIEEHIGESMERAYLLKKLEN